MLNRQFIQNIKSANNDNSLVIFVGAGISMSSNTKNVKLPSWYDLIYQMQKDLDEEETDYLKLAQLYYLAFGEFSYLQKIKEYFPDYIKPSNIHKQIFEINPHIIITTNWDNILERAVEENAYIYDIICSDKDLVKSSIQNKVVKMHGDFKNHNIVFKEDDYINYSNNFPLTENFIKSIISTHTVLFLGYSYNDVNLKQIIKWIQIHSSVRPPMYLTTFKENSTQINYLKNHGITTIVLEEMTIGHDFIDDYSNKMYTFLDKIINLDLKSILESNENIIEFVLLRLKPLNELNSILLDQIQKALTNCGYTFDEDGKAVLEFYQDRITIDKNQNIRKIYSQFTSLLDQPKSKQKPNENLLKIISILSKANIKGIITKNDIKDGKSYFPFSDHIKENLILENIDDYLNFDYSKHEKQGNQIYSQMNFAYNEYQNGDFEEAYRISEEVISQCLKQRKYIPLFISMFNRNVLLRFLKFGIYGNPSKFQDIEEYKLKEKFFNLPNDVQYTLEPIYNFIDHSFIYKNAYTLQEEIRKKEDSKKIIESGGFVFNSDITQFSSKHDNLIQFTISNRIMIDSYTEFRNINKGYIQISLLRQIQKSNKELNKKEIYSSIKFFSNKELKSILNEFYDADSNTKGSFDISDENKAWLLNNALKNITKLYLNTRKRSNNFEQYLENTLLILSLIELSEKDIKTILDYIDKIISEGKNTLGILQSINLFLGIQFNLYGSKIPEKFLVNILENLISKLIYKKFNGHEYMALTRNDLSNIYAYASNQKTIFKNNKLIEKLLFELKDYDISNKIDISKNLLINIYTIANEKIKDEIREFILKIDSSEEKDLFKRISFTLFLVIYDFKEMEDEIIKLLEEYLIQFQDGKQFSSGLYLLRNQVEFLKKNKNLKQLDAILTNLINLIDRHEKSDRLSII